MAWAYADSLALYVGGCEGIPCGEQLDASGVLNTGSVYVFPVTVCSAMMFLFACT